MSEEFQWMINKQMLAALEAIVVYGPLNADAASEVSILASMLEESPEIKDE